MKRTPEELTKINQGYMLKRQRCRQEIRFEQLKLQDAYTKLTRDPPVGQAWVIRGRRYPVSSIWEWWKGRASG